MKHLALSTLIAPLALPGLAAAQSLVSDPVSNLPITGEGTIVGGGWAQIYNVAELTSFLGGVLLALALAAVLALHPVRRASRSRPLDFTMPRLFAFYALVGMAVGFLVDQHGYIIGFVIFGIGALLRFRSNLDDPIDTVELILVTVIGLCVGLDFPVMALLITVVGWGVIWASGRRVPLELRLQSDDADTLDMALGHVRRVCRDEGWSEAFQHRSHAKHSARLILLHPATIGEEGVEAALSQALDETGVTWRLNA